jgi:hypothetical protein
MVLSAFELSAVGAVELVLVCRACFPHEHFPYINTLRFIPPNTAVCCSYFLLSFCHAIHSLYFIAVLSSLAMGASIRGKTVTYIFLHVGENFSVFDL